MYIIKKTHVKFLWNYMPGGPKSREKMKDSNEGRRKILRVPIGGGGNLIPGGIPRGTGAI